VAESCSAEADRAVTGQPFVGWRELHPRRREGTPLLGVFVEGMRLKREDEKEMREKDEHL